VIGAQRSGTTGLARLLDAHPAITMARPARPEPKVFCSDEATARGLDWYRRTWFGHARDETLLGDKSTSYLEDPQAPERAARMLGEPDVVAVLRDPVERAVSNWRFSTDNGLESRPLTQALEDNLRGGRAWDRSASSVSPFAYLERGRYAGYLAPWLARFPRTRVLFLADLLDRPGLTAARLFSDLGVDPDATAPSPTKVNGSRTPVTDVPAELLGRVRDYYADSDAQLATMLGRELPWHATDPTGGPR